MKRFLTICTALLVVCNSAWAWARLGHATVAKIAEEHLTKRAKKQLDRYMHGESIVKWASYADDAKPVLLLDTGFEPTNTTRLTTYPHTFEAEDDCTVFRDTKRNGTFVKNSIYQIERLAEELRHPERMTDSARITTIALIVHFVGDMHCPEHIRYPEDQTIGYYNVYLDGKKIRLHTLWDDLIVRARHPWSFSDLAELLDTASPQQIKDICAGTIYDWGYDCAKVSREVHSAKPEERFDRTEYLDKYVPLAESQIRKGGYRLAALLNSIFD